MDYEQKQRESFYLIKKYSSYTWYAEIYRLWKAFCDGYERDFYKFPVRESENSGTINAGLMHEPSAWDEQNLQMFWGYLANMDEGLEFIRQGNKVLGGSRFDDGTAFPDWLFSRRFEEIDLSGLGYRKSMADIAEGIFLYAQKARAMSLAKATYPHTDYLRQDFVSLPDYDPEKYAEAARKIKIPFGVPPANLSKLPTLDPSAPSVMSGEEVPCMGIWMVEPDEAHRNQTYCMAYLRPWYPAYFTVSEQEYELNSRYERTREEEYRKDWDKIKDYPVRWRLLWRDDRDYSHGNTPIEEADYLTYYAPATSTISATERLRCEAGQPCPKTGFWATPAKQDSRREFKQGDTMPSMGGDYGVTIWELQFS
jgi:hypothetical protein